jgi:hypothetical protein
MISVTFDDTQFVKEMNNIVAYSEGFLDGAVMSKGTLLKMLGIELKEMVSQFIDSNARIDPQSLHHVYEWYQTGSSDARLFDIEYVVAGRGLTMNATMTQSKSNPKGSNTPFYNKAKIMENGIPVTIKPKSAQVLSFEQNGKQVFTKGPVTVSNPGGDAVTGSFEETFKSFFRTYASQSILDVSGLSINLKKSREFDKNFAAAKTGGRPLGITTGRNWISKGVM